MSIVVRFHPTNLTAEQYDDVVRREKATGKYPPDGRDYHVCFGADGGLRVSEIWDSLEQLQAYGEVLMPILADMDSVFRRARGLRGSQHHQALRQGAAS